MAHEGSACAQDLESPLPLLPSHTYERCVKPKGRAAGRARTTGTSLNILRVWRFGGRGASRFTRCTKPPTGK